MIFLRNTFLCSILLIVFSCNGNNTKPVALKVKKPELYRQEVEEAKRADKEKIEKEQFKQEEKRKVRAQMEMDLNNAIGSELISNLYQNNSNGLLTTLKFESAEGYSGRLGAMILTNNNSSCQYVYSYNTDAAEIQTDFVNSTCGANSSDMLFKFDQSTNSLSCYIKGQKFIFLPKATSNIEIAQKPQPYFAGKTYGDATITLGQMRAGTALLARIPNASVNNDYIVVQYSFSCRQNDKWQEEKVVGNMLTAKIKEILRNVKSGDRVYFSDIIVRDANGKKERLGDLSFQLIN